VKKAKVSQNVWNYCGASSPRDELNNMVGHNVAFFSQNVKRRLKEFCMLASWAYDQA
jgi:hypothetical protein